MSDFLGKAEVEALRKKYPKGTKIRCINMEDGDPVPGGTIGTVDFIDDIGGIFMSWENGRTTPLIVGVDKFEVIE